jgi:hypothetical protein
MERVKVLPLEGDQKDLIAEPKSVQQAEPQPKQQQSNKSKLKPKLELELQQEAQKWVQS